MAQVIRPQAQNNNDLSSLLTIGGAVVGGLLGKSPQMAMAGAGAGQMAGGILSPQQAQQQSIDSQNSQSTAMARRQAQLSQDNLSVLKNAEAQLPTLPEDLRQQYAPAIIQARMMEERKRQGGGMA